MTTSIVLDNPVRGRINAWFFRLMDGYVHYKLGARKRELFADLPSKVVELGPGTGANFRYLRPGTEVLAVEPNRHMHPALRAAAERYGIRLSLVDGSAESFALPDASAEAVICSLVLCSVRDPDAVIAEVRRVLAPGGRFVCLEHVAARGGIVALIQRLVARPWRWLFEGCHTRRQTWASLERAGFSNLVIQRHEISGPFVPIRTQIDVVAVK
jgi:ubiquinone/menaquinone biosynthesis C-methylase UbiE